MAEGDPIYSRFVRPESVRLEISRGDWLLVKKQLNAGEQREVFTRMLKTLPTIAEPMNGHEAALQIDPAQAVLSTTLAYLLDWSLVDPDGQPVVIRGQPIAVVTAALNALDIDSYGEITQAIQHHDSTQTLERQHLRSSPFGAGASSPISTSAA